MPQDNNQWQVVSETSAAAPSQPSAGSWQVVSEAPALGDEHTVSQAAMDAARAQNPPTKQLAEAGIGAAKGAGETVSTVAKGINKIPIVGEYFVPKSGIAALDQATKTQNENEEGGKLVESIGEMMLGDESLKAIPFVKRLEMVAKAGKLAEEHPYLAKVLHAGATAVRQGSTTTGVGLAHGEDLPTAAKQGASVGALGGTLDAAASLAPDALSAAKNAVKKLSPNSIQPSLQQGIRDIVSKATEQTSSATASIRDAVERAGDEVYAKSKSLYAQLDQATGGQFQRFDEQLQNLTRKLRETAGLNDEQEAELLKKRADVEAAQQKSFEDAKAKGVDPALVDQAKANYRKAQALYDVDLNVKKSVSGMRPDVGSPAQAAKNPETVDPKKLFNRLSGLYDSGRLQDALGEQGADELLEHSNDHLIQHKKILRNQAVARAVGRFGGSIVAGAAGGSAVSHLAQ